MEAENMKESSVDLRNLEAKVGMKTPESLLRWMQADVQDCDLLESECLPGDLFTKIKTLKLEMRKLRSADVKILQQLEALNEEMECVRWLWEERGFHTSMTTNQNDQNETFISNSQIVSDLDQDNGKMSLTSAECAELYGYESVTDQSVVSRSSDHSTMRPELQEVPLFDEETKNRYQGLLLGRVESLEVQCSESPKPKEKQNDPDPYLLAGELLLGYDVRWRWVEREDDVMFL
ncbi:hypothetical protein MHYP_G00015260 [Metynnis hypsauchen]